MAESARLCFHCGEPVPSNCDLTVEVEEQLQPVCCSGCEAVANLILQSGQSRYYQFRTENALKPAEEDADIGLSWQRYDERHSLWGSPLKNGRYELLLQVEGIRCAACAWLIRSQLESREGIDALADGPMLFKMGSTEIPFTTGNFILSFSLPNFYFHATTTYDVLRMHGVPLGKVDYLGALRVGD